MSKTSVVFFGSGPVAAKSLALLANDFTIEAVITKPRPAHHKGSVPVIELAETRQLPVLTATNKQTLDELVEQNTFTSKVAILIDFGIIVSQKVIDTFPKGIINSHFSLLPEWRGADPITFAILSGQKQTGISLMLLVEAMDEGPILAHAVYDLPPKITTPELTEDLIKLSARMLRDVVPAYLAGTVDTSTQEEIAEITHRDKSPTYSRKLTKEDGHIDWTKPAAQIEREIRAYAGWPKSYCDINGHRYVIHGASVKKESVGTEPGTIIVDEHSLDFQTGEGTLSITSIQPEGKKEMPVLAFLNGYRDKLGL